MEDWTVELIDTGIYSQTGGRIKRLAPHIGNETFMLTWGDGVSTVDLDALVRFHRSHGKLATLTAVRPPARFGHLELDGDRIAEFSEKPQTGEGWINGAFFVLEPGVFDYIDGDQTQFEREPLERLAARRPADGVSPLRLLAVHGHAAREDVARRALGERQGALESLGLGRRRTRGERENESPGNGHNGYIGTVLVPMLQRGRARGRRPRQLSLRGVHVRRGRLATIPVSSHGRQGRDGRPSSTGFEAVLHLAAISNDPLGDLNPDTTYDINHRAASRLGRGWRRRQASAASSSPPPAASTAQAGDDFLDEEADFNPVTPYGESKVLAEQDMREPRRRRLQPDLPAKRDRLRRLAPTARRPRASTTSSATPSRPARS